MQRAELQRKREELASLDQKAKALKNKLKRAEDEVAQAAADLENLPPPPQGIEEQKKQRMALKRDLDTQVWGFTH